MQTNRQIIVTKDGSKTIYFPDIDENYHSKHGALQESKHVFLKHGLNHFLGKEQIKVFEVGFGTGLNALLTINFALENQKKIIYHTIEAYPITLREVDELNYKSFFDNPLIADLSTTIHTLEWDKEVELLEGFQFQKIHEKLQNHLLPENYYDCIFFDAFAPRVQDELWTEAVFQKMFDCLITDGLLVTYCAKGQVKRNLKQVGFVVESVEGPPGKREMTLAWKKKA